jgi:hypothetical protein
MGSDMSERDTANLHTQKLIEHLIKRGHSENKVQRQDYKAKQVLKSILPPHLLKFTPVIIPILPIHNMGRPTKNTGIPCHQLVRCPSPIGSLYR